jgi:signal transduction histidine kinase/DNA-binding response OmpR family regulator/streptogramin lyase
MCQIYFDIKNQPHNFSVFALILFCIVLWFLFQNSFAQTSEPKFEKLTVANGLSDNRVEAIIQDSKGFMWFGTPSGFDRYDGYDFINYGGISFNDRSLIYEDKKGRLWIIPGASDDLYRFDRVSEKIIQYPNIGHQANRVMEDRKGNIWIATWNNGLAKYLPEKDSFQIFNNKNGKKFNLPNNLIYTLFEDQSNNFWIGGDDGLYKFDRATENCARWNSEFNNSVISITEDKSGLLWLGTRNGLFQVDQSRSSFKRYENKELTSNQIMCIYEDSKNRLWVGGDLTTFRFDISSGKFTNYTNNTYLYKFRRGFNWVRNPILEDKHGVIWAGIQSTLCSFDENMQNFKIYNNSLNESASVCSMYRDPSGTVWFGSMKDGVYKYNGAEKPFHDVWNSSLRSFLSKHKIKASVISLFKDEAGILWIGKPDKFMRLDETKGSVKFFNLVPDDSIGYHVFCCIAEESPDVLWLGTFIGIFRFEKSTGKYTRFIHDPDNPNSLTDDICESLLIDHEGVLWITSGGTLEKYNPADKTFTHYHETANNFIHSIYEDKSNTFWVSTRQGIAVFDRVTGSFNYIAKDSINNHKFNNNSETNIFYEDKLGNFWVSTGNGLDKLDRKTLTLKHETDNLPKRIIGIMEDDHNTLWLLTAKGISSYNPLTGIIKNYGETDGINLNSSFYYPFCKDKSGQMYFGGFQGLVRFYPDSIRDNPVIPPIVITSFKESNKNVQLDSIISEKHLIKLSHSENNVSFEFAALNYSLSQKNQYAYKLEGLDKNWVYSGTRRFASYPSLQPGKYTLRVKGSNNDGVWNETGTFVSLIITPPWWKTNIAYFGYVLLCLIAFYLIRRYELSRLSFKNQVILDDTILKEKEENDRMKSRFFANISHEFRTPLTLILGPAEKIVSGTSENVKKDANIVLRNSHRLLQLINQLLQLSKLDSGKLNLGASEGNIVQFVKGIAFSFESLAESKDILLSVQSEKENIKLFFDKEKMGQILTNLFSNAFKFTPGGGTVIFSVEEANLQMVEIKIRDSGIGIAPEELPKLFDRFYQVKSSLSREYEGTGIGLALTKELVELHHGVIQVESKEAIAGLNNSGWTEFTVKLPLGRDHLTDEEIKNEEEKTSGYRNLNPEEIYVAGWKNAINQEDTIRESQEEKTIILVVEDNADMREYIKESLDKNFIIQEAENGENGVNKALEIIPDLVLSDMMMPGMDGSELVRILKNDERTSHIPVIILTARAGQENKLDGLETGADEYLTKPFDSNELNVRIKNLISIRKKLQEKYSKTQKSLPETDGLKFSSIDEKFMQKVRQVIDKHISQEEFDITEFCSEVAMSRTQLHRKLKALTGQSASLYVRSVKLGKAKKMIDDKTGTISEIAYSLGFSSPAYFTRCFREEFGYPPSALKK